MTIRERVQCEAHKLVSPSKYRYSDTWEETRAKQRSTDRCSEDATRVTVMGDGSLYYTCDTHGKVFGRILRWTKDNVPVEELPDHLYAQLVAHWEKKHAQAVRNQSYHESQLAREKDAQEMAEHTLATLRAARAEVETP